MYGTLPTFNFKVYSEKRCFTTLLTKHHVPLMHSSTLNIYPGETLLYFICYTYKEKSHPSICIFGKFLAFSRSQPCH